MCGIAGIRRLDGAPVDARDLRAMIEPLKHRGPDDQGIWSSGSVGFGHTRLSIIDLADSTQPMSTADGTFHLTYNGEVFNYRALREDLLREGVELRTSGDTETLLELCRRRGEKALESLNGQFAFACYDQQSDDLWLVRDRLGILPLYYYRDDRVFAFASEIKSLLRILDPAPEIDDEAVEQYLTYGSVPPPRTLFEGIRKLPPGHVLHVDARGKKTLHAWWRVPVGAASATGSDEEWIERVERKLYEAVELRLVADVPVGAYLSGGLDSSLVVALMKRARDGGAVATFSAGFQDPRFDELPYARIVSTALGTEHHEVIVTADDFREQWEALTWHRDGPLSQPADVAVSQIAARARESVKVLLSGEGADEIFAGYPKHRFDRKLSLPWMLPGFVRRPLFRAVERMLPYSMKRPRIAARALASRTVAERLQSWFTPFTWYERRALRAGYGELDTPEFWERSSGDPLGRMLHFDCHTWLSDNLLERGDRMSMAQSIENRPPFLDHELVELAFQVPSRLKIRDGEVKWILRQIAHQVLPETIAQRKKLGFTVPLDEWFKGGLRDYSHDLLLGNDSFVGTYLDRDFVAALLRDHRSGRRNEEMRLWNLLGLEVWHRCFRGQIAAQSRTAA